MEKDKGTFGASSSSGVSTQADVEAMMAKLGLKEDDLDDVIFEEEVKQPEEDTRWMAVARVHTESEFSHYWFYKNMRSAWDLAKDVKIRAIEDNLFTLRFACLGD
jgi:3-hydroxyisobutyrate dehydrogenase-like beta-hydroxyacid dehydrogenase